MHVAIIMDGNRTWANNVGLAWLEGHKKGADALKSVVQACPNLGIKVLTVYAFSTENFGRPQDQVDGILHTIARQAEANASSLVKQNIRVTLLGNLAGLPASDSAALTNLVEATKHGNRLLLQLAVNYGGRDEIVRAAEKVVLAGQMLTEETISNALDSALQPDIVIRTGGQTRISNFLLWQSAYSEFFFVEKNWPAFTGNDLADIVEQFKLRTRKFGK